MNNDAATDYLPLRQFARLVGSWELTHRDLNTGEEWRGHDIYEWLPGGRFLTFRHHEDGNGGIDGIMVIGQEMGWEQTEPSDEIVGHWFESSSGHHYKYIWEVEEDAVRFWLNNKQSGWFFSGEFSEGGNVIQGTWQWPGGGYTLLMQREVSDDK